VAVLPDSNASRYNPSLKVYPATVEIEGTHEFLKPGMSAKVEIIVNELENVTYVPVQSVFVESQEHFVFLKTLAGYDRQLVEIGANNNDFIEIRDGLDKGDEVFLKMPDDYEAPQLQIANEPSKRVIESGHDERTASREAAELKKKAEDNA